MKRRNTVSTRVASVALALLATVALVAQTGAQQGGGRAVSAGGPRLELVEGRQAIAGDVLVKFRRPLASREQVQLESDLDAEYNDGIGGAGVRRIHSRRHGAAGLLAFLRAHPDVEYAGPNYVITSDATPNDTSFSSMWGLLNTGQTIGVAGTPGRTSMRRWPGTSRLDRARSPSGSSTPASTIRTPISQPTCGLHRSPSPSTLAAVRSRAPPELTAQ